MTIKNKDSIIIAINQCDYGSTGNIMLNSLEYAHEYGPFDVLACIPYETKQINKVRTLSFAVKISKIKRYYYAILRRLKFPIINDGNYYKEYTKRLIQLIKQESGNYKTTIIHMHNMHMCNLDVNVFYRWLGKHNEYKVLYTLHDCWTFTGGCYCYDFIGCNKWQHDCKKCPQHIKYSNHQLRKRTKLINKIPKLTLVPCSKWLEAEITKSRLKNIETIVNNGETSLEPFVGKSNLKEKLGITNKKILISVSAYWNDWKGIKYLYKLADLLPNDYILILVGGSLDEKHNKIIHIPLINDNKLLAEYYSIADVFVSTTQSDNLPLVLMEAQICGLPIVGFGHGGTPEEITEKSGIMVGTDNDVNKLFSTIVHVIDSKEFRKEDIIASGNRFKKNECSKRQLSIYKNVIHDI